MLFWDSYCYFVGENRSYFIFLSTGLCLNRVLDNSVIWRTFEPIKLRELCAVTFSYDRSSPGERRTLQCEHRPGVVCAWQK